MCLADIVMTELNVSAQPAIVDFATATPEISISRPAADRLLAGSPEHKASNVYSDPSGRLFAGVWDSTSGKWRVRYTEAEFCHITAGRVRITDGSGRVREFGPGASFVIPSGFEGTWEVLEPVRKLYVIYEA